MSTVRAINLQNPEWQDIIHYTHFSFQNGFSKPKSEDKKISV